MTSFLAITKNTVRQLTGRTRVVSFTILSLLPALLLWVASRSRDVAGLDTDLGGLLVTPFFAIVVPLTALILAGSTLADERRDTTLSFLVLRPVSRFSIAGAKTLAAALTASMYSVFAVSAMVAVFAASTGSLALIPSLAVGAILASVIYSAVFCLLGNVVSRPTLVGLLYVLFFEANLVGELPRLAPASPWRVGLSASLDLAPAGFPVRALYPALGDLAPSALNALIGTVVVLLISVVLNGLVLKRTDAA